MPEKAELRELVRAQLDSVGQGMNAALQGRDLDVLESQSRCRSRTTRRNCFDAVRNTIPKSRMRLLIRICWR